MFPAAVILIVLAVGMAIIRFAPVGVARWHQRPALVVPASAGWGQSQPGVTAGVQTMQGGAYAAVLVAALWPADLLQQLDALALATPRTRKIAGSVAEGMITWETRSAFFGFPDYTTAQIAPGDGGCLLYLVGRQGFGYKDFGVNAARLSDWLRRLSP